MATHSSILVWEIPWTEECGGLQVHRVSKSQTQQKRLSKHTCSRKGPGARSKCRFLFLTMNQPTWNLWSMGPGHLANSLPLHHLTLEHPKVCGHQRLLGCWSVEI